MSQQRATSARTVLVCGAGIGGPVFAHWARRRGMHPIVIERAPEPRRGGASVDFRGAGRVVMRRMGLEQQMQDAATGEVGMTLVDDEAHPRAWIPAAEGEDTADAGITSELEIPRGELGHLLHEATRDDVDYVFGDHVVAIEDGRGARGSVRVTLASGQVHDVDVVVGADGLGSATRRLAFGDHGPDGRPWLRHLGVTMAFLSMASAPEDTAWSRWQHAPGGRVAIVRPSGDPATAQGLLSFLSKPRLGGLDAAARRTILRERFDGLGGVVPRILDALDAAPDHHSEDIGQIHLDRLHRGRVVLLGDAGYCASPVSGTGTTLAVVGGYVLAQELGRHDDHTAAFAAYEARMRPLITQAQRLPLGVPRLVHPRTRPAIAATHALARGARLPLVDRIVARLAAPRADDVDLAG